MIFGIFGTEFSVFSVFFASYHFVSHPKNSVSLQSETSETNLFFSLFRFAHFRFPFASFRFQAKWGDTLVTTESNSAVSPLSQTLQYHCGVILCGVTTESNSAVSPRSQTLQYHCGVKLCGVTTESNFAVSPRSQTLQYHRGVKLCGHSNLIYVIFQMIFFSVSWNFWHCMLFCMIKTSFEDISRQFLNIKHHADTAER